MPDSQPTSPDAQVTVDATGAGGTEANQASEAAKAAIELDALSKVLGRKFESVEDAIKSVQNLNGLVGDRTIADLRKKAEAHDTLEALVNGYAKEEGVSIEDARKQLFEKARTSQPAKDERVDVLQQTVNSLAMQLQEKDFLVEHPEAKSVIKELKALATAGGQTLAEAYESSALKDLAAKAAASVEREKMGSSARPSTRTAVPNSKVKEAIERLKSDPSGDAQDAVVKAALGL